MNAPKSSLPLALALAVFLQGCSKPIAPLSPEEQTRLEDLSSEIRAKIQSCGGVPRATQPFEVSSTSFGFRVPFHASDDSRQEKTRDCVGGFVKIMRTEPLTEKNPCLPYNVSDLSSVAVHCLRD